MNPKILILAMALGATTCLVTAQDDNQGPPEGQRPPAREGTNAPGMHRPAAGFHLLPPRAQEQLKLTADQQKQVAALETEVKAKLEKILTPEQMAKLKEMRPLQRPGGQRGPGGPGGQGHPGGKGGPGGENPPPQE